MSRLKKQRGRAFPPSPDCPARAGLVLEVVLQDELDDAVTTLQVDLPEVVDGLLVVVEAAGRVADVLHAAAAVGRIASDVTHRVQGQVDIVPDVRVRERLVEQVEESE